MAAGCGGAGTLRSRYLKRSRGLAPKKRSARVVPSAEGTRSFCTAVRALRRRGRIRRRCWCQKASWPLRPSTQALERWKR